MKRLLCALLGHKWKRTGISRVSGGLERLLFREYQCARCRNTMWE